MSKSKFSNEDVLKLLIKKATGFYYTEEQYEYEKTQNKYKSSEIIDKCNNLLSNSDTVEQQISFLDDKIKISNEKQHKQVQKPENLTLVKKKVATHYVSPDMLAIKILLEIYGKEINSIENIADDELINLKNKLIGELLNEENEN